MWLCCVPVQASPRRRQPALRWVQPAPGSLHALPGWPIRQLHRIYDQIINALTYAEGFFEILEDDEQVENIIQLVCNPEMEFPHYYDSDDIKKRYLATGKKEPEVPMLTIPTVDGVDFNGDFDFVVMAQSPNYTPESADFIMDIFREYIEEY